MVKQSDFEEAINDNTPGNGGFNRAAYCYRLAQNMSIEFSTWLATKGWVHAQGTTWYAKGNKAREISVLFEEFENSIQ